eukprot:Opistho-1_new@28296
MASNAPLMRWEVPVGVCRVRAPFCGALPRMSPPFSSCLSSFSDHATHQASVPVALCTPPLLSLHLGPVRDYRVDLDAKSVVVTSGLPSHELLLALRNTGLRVALRGLGGADACMVEVKNLGAAVCIMNAGGVLPSAAGVCGVVRFVQVSEGECVVEGTVDGLAPGLHGLHMHEFGDLSDGCLSAGDHYNPTNEVHGDRLSERRHAGDLGNVRADATGRASFRFSDRLIKASVSTRLEQEGRTGVGYHWAVPRCARGRRRPRPWRPPQLGRQRQLGPARGMRCHCAVGGCAAEHQAGVRVRRARAVGRPAPWRGPTKVVSCKVRVL